MSARLRTVLAGCGRVSEHWLAVVAGRADLEIVGLADVQEESARAKSEAYGLRHVQIDADVRALLRSLRPDLVIDCTPPDAREQVVLAALAEGCHVLAEKPMAESLESASRMVREAERARRVLAIGQNHRYMPVVQRFARAVRSGRLGPLTGLDVGFFIARQFSGFRVTLKHPLLLDMAVHTFDTVRFVSGLEPLSVYCEEWNPEGSWFAGGAAAAAIFRMTGGVAFVYRGSWCAPGLPTSWPGQWRVTGRQGSATWDGEMEVRVQASPLDAGRDDVVEDVPVEPAPERNGLGQAELLDEFLRCLGSGQEPPTACTDNIRSLAMVHAAIASARTGERVTIGSRP